MRQNKLRDVLMGDGEKEGSRRRRGKSESNYRENEECISINLYMSIPLPHPLLVPCALNINDSEAL